jgi:hypothetical protein
MLRELAPGANRFVALVNPNSAFTDAVVKDLQASALALGLPIEILRAGTGREIDAAFANLVQKPDSALLSSAARFLPPGVRKSSRWRRATRYPRSTLRVNMPRSAG